MKVKGLCMRAQCFPEYTRVVALLEHVEVHLLLVNELNPLHLCVSVEGVHQHQWDVALVLLICVLDEKKKMVYTIVQTLDTKD